MKVIPTVGYLEKLIEYNPETGIFTRLGFSKDNERMKKLIGKPTGNQSCNGYISVSIDSKRYLAHALAWYMYYGYYPDFHIDHYDGDKSNNAISNLRPSSPSENQKNRGKNKNNSSGSNGVYAQPNGRWRARVRVNGKMVNIGTYINYQDACKARQDYDRLNGFSINHGVRESW